MTIFAAQPFQPNSRNKNGTTTTTTTTTNTTNSKPKKRGAGSAASGTGKRSTMEKNQPHHSAASKASNRILKGNLRLHQGKAHHSSSTRLQSKAEFPDSSTRGVTATFTTSNLKTMMKSGTKLPSTPVKLDRSLQLEHVMPNRQHALKHPIDHCYDVQTLLQTPHKSKANAKWRTYCPHHHHVFGDDRIEKPILERRKGSYIYIVERDHTSMHVREMYPVPNDVIVGATSGKYHSFWFLRDDPSAAYVTSLSEASVGQLGLGSTIKKADFHVPQMIRFKKHAHQGNVNRIEPIQIACGEMHSLFVVQGGKRLYSCGSNLRGACGLGASRCIQEATRVRLPDGYIVMHAAAGDSHSIIVARNENMFDMYDEVFVMGSAKSGALGMIGTSMDDGQHAPLDHVSSARGSEAGASSAAKVDDIVDFDQPANASKCWVRRPTRLEHSLLQKNNFKAVVCGAQHTLLQSRSGEVYGMGLNEGGCLGLGHENPVHEPQVVFRCSSLNNESITHIACGASHSIIVTNYRNIYVAGSNKLYQLGLDHNIDINTFTRLKHNVFEQKVIRLVKCGRHVTVIVTGDNCVFCFGGRFGELNESRFLRLSDKDEEIYDVTVENNVPMIVLGKKKQRNRNQMILR